MISLVLVQCLGIVVVDEVIFFEFCFWSIEEEVDVVILVVYC